LIAGLLAAAWAGLTRSDARETAAVPKTALLLFTSLPIYWGEAADLAEMLNAPAKPWPRTELERRHDLVPIDAADTASLSQAGKLLMAQPRPLAPAENVALDRWLGEGGRLLLFADPALTTESAFAVGDRRRPEAVVLLSPILARWGLRLEFDEEQALGERHVGIGGGVRLPINLPGRFALARGGRSDAACRLEHDGLVARCSVGSGRLTAVADAALLETGQETGTQRQAMARLEALAF
jgi:hypothetical protein